MILFDLLIGKKVSVMTDMNVKVELEVKSIQENHHSENLEPATRENDWWPNSRDWTNYTVHFTNGASKVYDNINSIEIIE